MKALTICQPYPYLIMLPSSDPRHKRVENRRYWNYRHRGPLLIHAGKSMEWCTFDDHGDESDWGIRFGDLHFGVLLGVADLIAVIDSGSESINGNDVWTGSKPIVEIPSAGDPIDVTWIRHHKHTEGEFCLVLDNIRSFPRPIAYRGFQGIFEVPDHIVAEQLAAATPVENVMVPA